MLDTLNDDCFEEITHWLDIKSIVALSAVCKRTLAARSAVGNRSVVITGNKTTKCMLNGYGIFIRSAVFVGNGYSHSRDRYVDIDLIAKSCPNLVIVKFDRCTGIRQGPLTNLMDAGNISSISFESCPDFTDDSLASISSVIHAGVEKCRMISDVGLIKLACSCPELQTMLFSHTNTTSLSITVIASSCPKLKKITFDGCTDTTDSIIHHLVTRCSDLEEISFKGTDVTSNGVDMLMSMCKFSEYQRINLTIEERWDREILNIYRCR